MIALTWLRGVFVSIAECVWCGDRPMREGKKSDVVSVRGYDVPRFGDLSGIIPIFRHV